MKTFTFVLTVALLASQAPATEQTQAPVNPGFEKMKSLVGEWKGKMPEGDEVKTSYRLVGADSAIEETMSHGNMVTMYHTDGKRLMLTHYCAAQNQPRMRAAAFKPGDDTLKFSFFDATNLPNKFAMRMHNLIFTFHDNDHFTQVWTLYQDGRETQKVVINLERVK